MPYWYWRPILPLTELKESVSNPFDLPERGALSGLSVHLEAKNASTLQLYPNAWALFRSKWRMVGNGNYEIINAEARHLAACAFHDMKKVPVMGLANGEGNYQTFDIPIPFGRYLGDPKYGLTLEKFGSGVQFEETNTFSTTYLSDTYSKLKVDGLFRKDPEPGLFSGGFFKKRQIVNKDAASEVQYGVKLPTANKLKQIHMFSDSDLSSYLRAASIWSVLSTVWLGVKSKEEYLIDNMGASTLSKIMANQLGLFPETKGYVRSADGASVFWETCIGDLRESALATVHNSFYHSQEDDGSWLDSIAEIKFSDMATSAVAGTGTIHNKGLAFMNMLPLLGIDPLADETEYLDADKMKDVYVEFTEGNSAGNIFIVLDELQKSYPS